jgi:hypothetical protein
VLLFVVFALIAGHLLVPYALSHLGASVILVSGLAAVLLFKHVGLLAAGAAALLRRVRGRPRSD